MNYEAELKIEIIGDSEELEHLRQELEILIRDKYENLKMEELWI